MFEQNNEPEFPLTYKKFTSEKLYDKTITIASDTDTPSPITSSQSPPPFIPFTLSSRRGILKPGIKTALPPTVPVAACEILKTSADSTIMTPAEMRMIVSWMPKYHHMHEFHLTYALKRDGASLEAIYSLCSHSDVSSSFIVIEDKDGYVFGGFLNERFKKSTRFYGSGDSFVFSIRPHQEVHRWQHDPSKHDNNTAGRGDDDGENIDKSDLGMFVLSDDKQIIMGGDGGFAFCLDDELLQGYSQASGTYNNKCLSKQEFFSVLNVEVWTTRPAAVVAPPLPSSASLKNPAVVTSFPATALQEPPIVLTKK